MRLAHPLSKNAAVTLRGIADYYVWKGLPIVRSWPRKPQQPNTPAQLATREALRSAQAWIASSPPQWLSFWRATKTPPNKSYRDLIVSLGIRYALRSPLPVIPVISALSITPSPLHNTTLITITVIPPPLFNANLFTFHARPYVSSPHPLSWTAITTTTDRHGAIVHKWQPVLSPYMPPLAQLYDPDANAFLATYPTTFPQAAIIALSTLLPLLPLPLLPPISPAALS